MLFHLNYYNMGFIKKSVIDKIYEIAKIDEVIGDFVQLKRAGSNLKGKSPFIEEKSPSFMVSPVKQIWKDFSSGKGGNVVSFLMQLPSKSFTYVEALEYLANKYNIILEYENEEFAKKIESEKPIKDSQLSLMKAVHAHYVNCLEELPDNHPAVLELKRREYTKEEIIDYKIGFAPENSIYDMIRNSGRVDMARTLGLLSSKLDSNYEMYSNRLIYPIQDKFGNIIGFGGRDTTGKNKPKWINSTVNAENKIYNKSKALYGIDKAINQIRKSNATWLVEGYNDVIAFQRFGLENTVSGCGTSITEGQLHELKKYCNTLYFALDPDKAGLAAVLRILPIALSLGFRTNVLELELDPDDFCRQYHDVIVLSGGLDEMFNSVPGLIKDGFQLLIETHITKSTNAIDKQIKFEESKLDDIKLEMLSEIKKIDSEINDVTELINNSKKALSDIEVNFGKKSDQYKNQKIEINQLEYQKKNLVASKDFKDLKDQKNLIDELIKELQIKKNKVIENTLVERTEGAKYLFDLIKDTQDDLMREIYFNAILSSSRINKNTFNSWIKDSEKKATQEYISRNDLKYILPYEVDEDLNTHLKCIEIYGLFMSGNRIYMCEDPTRDGKVYFSCVSNFTIEILQHMNDEKFPMKLIRMKNILNQEIIFDTESSNLNTPQKFDDMCTSHGNFNFDGDRKQLLKLRTYLFDNMGTGKKIEVLGWQPSAKFWVWNNLAMLENGTELPIDSHGIIVIDNTHYYIPSANSIYADNTYKFEAQKRFRHIPNDTSFTLFLTQVKKVHRDHTVSAILFSISCLFRDIIVQKLNRFPILFLYGPGGTGKDELAEIVQGFTGIPQTAINLEGELSTGKASIRELAQFRNGISQLSEYKRGNKQHDGMLKQVYDLRGYKRGNIESHIGTDSIPVDSGVILTGNDFPDAEALIQRLIWNEMTKNVFTQEELKEFDILKDMVSKGISGYAHEILKHRLIFIEQFESKQRAWKGILKERFPEAKERMIANLSILSAVYQICRDNNIITFPFSQDEMLDHWSKGIDQQLRKINAASLLVKFWECFISSLRGNPEDRIQVNRIVRAEGSLLYIQWTHAFAKVQKQWWTLYHEPAPSKATILEQIEKEPGLFNSKVSSYSFDSGRDAVRSSAIVLNFSGMSDNLKNDIVSSIEFQLNEKTLFDNFPQTTPSSKIQEEHQEDLPFSG